MEEVSDERRRELKKEKKKKKFLTLWVPVIVVCFVLLVVFVWYNNRKTENSQGQPQQQQDPQAQQAQQQAEYQSWLQNLLQQKQFLTEKLKSNYESAINNRKLFQSMNAEADEENIETSFILKDERDSSKAKLLEENKRLLDEKNSLVQELQKVDSFLQQQQVAA